MHALCSLLIVVISAHLDETLQQFVDYFIIPSNEIHFLMPNQVANKRANMQWLHENIFYTLKASSMNTNTKKKQTPVIILEK